MARQGGRRPVGRGRADREWSSKSEQARAQSGRRRRWKWIAALCVVGVLVGIGCVAAAATLARDYATRLTGSLDGVREVSFVEGSQDDGGISPVCGCEHPPLDAWRGVTFAARGVTLTRVGGPDWTQWYAVAAEPDTVSLALGSQYLRAEALRLAPNGDFDPRSVLPDRGARPRGLLERTRFNGLGFSLYTHHVLHVAMLGPVPVGAWLPFPGSKVTLTAARSEFLSKRSQPRLIENYSGQIGLFPAAQSRRRGLEYRPQIFPLGDFLGPDIVLWTDDPDARIPGTEFSEPRREAAITAVVLRDPNFSLRVASAPVSIYDIENLDEYATVHPRDARERFRAGPDSPGRLTLAVEHQLDRSAYDALRRRVHAHERTWIRVKLPPEPVQLPDSLVRLPQGMVARAVARREYREEERYPPLPEFAGLNIFGPLNEVAFHGVRGTMMIADKLLSLRGPADVVLGDVQGLSDGSGHQLISAPLATSEEAADLEFRAVGTATVNGVPKTTVSSHLEPLLAIVGTVLAIVGGVIGIFATLWRLRESS